MRLLSIFNIQKIIYASFLYVIPLGWLITFRSLGNYSFIYLVLSVISFVFVILSLRNLTSNFKSKIHFWIIFILLFAGYYFKYYLYIVLLSIPEVLNFYEDLNPVVTYFKYDPEMIIKYFSIITLALGTFVLALYTIPKKQFIEYSSEKIKVVNLTPSKRQLVFNRLKVIFLSILLFSIFILILVYIFKIGVPSVKPTYLPFKLAGVINLTQKRIIPISLILVLYFSDLYQFKSLSKQVLIGFGSYSSLNALITTSRTEFVFPVLAILIYLIFRGYKFNISPKKSILLIFSIPGIIILYTVLGVLRQVVSVIDLDTLGLVGIELIQELNNVNSEYSASSQIIIIFVGLLLRIQGADGLINILYYKPEWSFNNFFEYFSPNYGFAYGYTEKVLDYDLEVGTLFSPSILGSFYLLIPYALGAALCLFIYIIFWDSIYKFTYNSFKTIFPAVAPYLSTSLVYYTSEGGINDMIRVILTLLLLVKCIDYIFIYLGCKPKLSAV